MHNALYKCHWVVWQSEIRLNGCESASIICTVSIPLQIDDRSVEEDDERSRGTKSVCACVMDRITCSGYLAQTVYRFFSGGVSFPSPASGP